MQILCTLKNIGYHSGARIQCTILKDQAAHVEFYPIIFVTNIMQDLCNIQKFFKKETAK